MSLTYAGQDLSPKTPEIAARMARWWIDEAPTIWQWPGYEMERLRHLPVPAPPGNEPARLNTLYWPTGASRWATFYALVGGVQAAAILAAVDTNSPTPQPLVLSDPDNGTQINPDMHILGLRPVFVQDDGAELWFLQLVDERYFWWTQSLTYTFVAGDSWSTLLTNLVTATGTPFALTVPTISSNYGTPSPARWSAPGRPLPLLIDAAAMSVGLRFIRKLDGTMAYVDSATASAADLAQYNANQPDLVFGGRIDVDVLSGNVPASVNVAFWGDAQLVSNVTLASLSLPAYGTITGVANTAGWVAADLYANAGGAARANYATQAATDYYGWLLSQTDATFRGVRQLNVTGQEDRIEWEFQPGRYDVVRAEPVAGPLSGRMPWERVLTRVVRQNWGDQNQYADRPPPGYVYRVKLTAQDGTTNHWKSLIQIVSGGAVADGPQLGFGVDDYVLYATGTPSVNDIGTAVPDPLIPFAWLYVPSGAVSPPPPPPVPCADHGYLADRQANIDMATATPPRVMNYEVFAGVGRCACIAEQGRDSTAIPYPYTAFWDATAGTRGRWVGSVFIQTCCGCARLEFDIPEENGDLVDDWPPAQGYLYLNTACDSSSVTDPYILKYQCSGDGFTVFAGAGPKNCSGVAPFPCNNSFLVLVKCADCTLGQGPDCQYCKEICGPPIFTVTVSGMTGGYTDYNGKWYLIPDGDCTWRATCGSIIVTLTITVVGGTTFVTVTFAGASGGGLTYKDIGTSGSNILCADSRTLNTVSPPNPAVGVPATIAVATVSCTSCPDFCTWLVANHPTLHVTFGMDGTGSVACINGTSWTLNWDAVNSWWTTGSVSAPVGCTPNTMGDFKITCSNGRLTLISEFTGPPTPFSLTNQVSRTVSPLVVVLNGAITATITA